jgi:hypothetical protein
MNDFTKEELEDLLSLVQIHCCNSISVEDFEDYWLPLKDKLQLLADNYCEHKESEIGIIAKDMKDCD